MSNSGGNGVFGEGILIVYYIKAWIIDEPLECL